MSAVAFDTLKLARTLRDTAKMTQEQAEGIADALAEAMSGAELATKTDIAEIHRDMATKIGLAETKAEMLKSIMGMMLAAATFNTAVAVGAMFGLAKLLGH